MAGHPERRGVRGQALRPVHGDFTPWNPLFDHGRLTGVLDFEATHHTYQVADFALSWRGYHDDVLVGYDKVRPLPEVEWRLASPILHLRPA
ncbi:phosphotransferase [Micromonospora peucetia]|uniref:phosphotransferase n=1 Tax=Micromonospora peucetia TaxID=47871 RepID=UPI00332C3D4D